MDKVTKKIKAAIRLEGSLAGLFPGIGLFLVGSTQQIVYTDSIEICKCVQHGNGNVQLAKLIIGICGLMHPKQVGKLFLLEISVFPHITQTVLIHNNHP